MKTDDPLYGAAIWRFSEATGFDVLYIKHYVNQVLDRDQQEFVRRFILWFQGIEPKNQSLEIAVMVHTEWGDLELDRDGWYPLDEVA